jgi:hypothetical protein
MPQGSVLFRARICRSLAKRELSREKSKTGLWMRKSSKPGTKHPTLEEARRLWEEQRQRILERKRPSDPRPSGLAAGVCMPQLTPLES